MRSLLDGDLNLVSTHELILVESRIVDYIDIQQCISLFSVQSPSFLLGGDSAYIGPYHKPKIYSLEPRYATTHTQRIDLHSVWDKVEEHRRSFGVAISQCNTFVPTKASSFPFVRKVCLLLSMHIEPSPYH